MKTLATIVNKAPYKWFCYKERGDEHYLACKFNFLGLFYNNEILSLFNGEDPAQSSSQLSIFTDQISHSDVLPINAAIDEITVYLKNGNKIAFYAYK